MADQPLITEQPGLPLQAIPQIEAEQGEPIEPAPGCTWVPFQPPIQGVPAGLEYLAYLDMLQIYKLKWSRKDRGRKFALRNADQGQVYYAIERRVWDFIDCICCGDTPTVIDIVDRFGKTVLTMKHEEMCCGNNCIGTEPACTIEHPTLGILGSARPEILCLTCNYVISDADGNMVLDILGICCELRAENQKLRVRGSDGITEIGAIRKKWGKWLGSSIFSIESHILTFPTDLDVKMKAALIAATFLQGYLQFKQK